MLPAEGYYCAVIFDVANPKPGVDFPRHKFYSTIEELSDALLAADAQGRTVFHACASYADPAGVVDEKGKRHVRSKANVRAARSLWLDVDCGPGKPYSDAQTAAEAVVVFCRATALPQPVFVGSGIGLHVYWPLDRDLDPESWTVLARHLKDLTLEHGLKAGPERTADITSILRTPGTHHRKNGERDVVWSGIEEKSYAPELFVHVKTDADVQHPQRRKLGTPGASIISRILSTTGHAAVYADDVADGCGQLRALRVSGNLPEPTWYAALGVLAFCEDGDAKAHAWSARDYLGYSRDVTQHRLERARGLSGATTCAKFNDVSPGTCNLCPHVGRITSPVSARRVGAHDEPANSRGLVAAREDTARMSASVSGEPSVNLAPPPDPFIWSSTKQLLLHVEGEEGSDDNFLVCDNPIYLDSVQTGEIDSGNYSYRFMKYLPNDGWAPVIIDAGLMHSASGIAAMFGKGVVIHDAKLFLKFVRHSVDDFHDDTVLERRYDQFGWKSDNTSFFYGKMLYTAAGPVEAVGAKEVTTRAQWLGPKKGGSLPAWTEACDSLFAAEMEGISAAVLSSFAAPLMRFQSAEEGGAILHVYTPQSGMGKTTALMGAWTAWGTREGLSLTNEDTQVSKPIALGTLGNLPVIYDELRNKDPEVIRRMVVMFTEGRDRMRGTVDGTIRHTKASWQTVMISAANNSLIDQLQGDGTDAPAFRVLELNVELSTNIDKAKGDRLKRVLTENAGHAGDAYLRYLLQPEVLAWTKQALETWTQEIWTRTRLDSAHRFRVRLVGAIAVAAALVNKLDILHFQTDRVVEYLLKQIGDVKNVGTVSAVLPLERAIHAFGQFINEHYAETLVVPDRYKTRQRMVPILKPHNALSIRYEIATQRVFISESRFREWALKKQLSPRTVLQQLKDQGVIVDFKRPVTLSAGTDIPGAQVLCIEANAAHPVMSGLVSVVSEVQAAS